MRFISLALLLSAAPLFAQQHDFFAPNFTPSPCAAANSCGTFTDSELPNAAFKFYGLKLDMHWVEQHRDEVLKIMEVACKRHATCLAIPRIYYSFCDDVLAIEAHSIAKDKFPGDEQFGFFIETWLLGIDIKAKARWEVAQKCANDLPPQQHTKPIEIWMVPPVLPPNFQGKVTFYALDPDTHLPVYAEFTFDNQIVYAPSNPVGRPATVYPFDFKVKYNRVPNAQGHRDVVAPTVTATVDGYPDIKFPLAAEIPKWIVDMKPPPEKLHRGKNTFRIEARDATTGKPVEARVMMGEDPIGETNLPITIELKRKLEHREIWVTSLFDRYSDVVVVKKN